MNAELRKKAGVEPTPPAITPPAAAPKEGDEPPAAAAAPPAETGKSAKPNPWKLVDEYKAKLAKAEADHLETSKRAISKVEWDTKVAEFEAVAKRAKELEEEIIYTNYSKSKDFKDKYQAPYNSAWKRAMADLSDLTVDVDGQPRKIGANDMLELVNMTLPKAREAAEQLFGTMANDVMNHRNKIRELFDDQSAALDEARTNGATREKARMEQFQSQQKEVQKVVLDGWKASNEKAMADPNVSRFLKPVEGDTEWNSRLERATKLADQAFSENAMTPGLTPEKRSEIVERHAAVRNRAIAYSMLRYENTKHEARIKELEAELAGFKATEPEAAGSTPPAGTPPQPKGMAGIRAGLERIAK